MPLASSLEPTFYGTLTESYHLAMEIRQGGHDKAESS
jgi:hypothetical protein